LQTSNNQLGLLNNDLTNLLGSVNVAILMVDNNLNLRRFTPMAERLLDLIPSDAGRPLTFMNRGVLGEDLAASVRHVIDSLTPIEREATDETGHWYLLRIRPYRTRENKIEGAVILLIDINDIRRALDAVLDLVKQPLLLLGADLRVRNANEAFRATFGVGAEQVVGKMIYEAGEGKWDVPTLRKLLEEVLPLSKQVKDFEIEASFPKVGKRNLRLNGSRFFDESQTIQLILLAIEDVT
jgi:two-component system CheB/CheR fusion protein